MPAIGDSFGKIRCFAIDRVSGRPAAGVSLQLQLELPSGQLIPAGLLASDSVGYLSFDLKGLNGQGPFPHLWLTPVAHPTDKVDLLDQLRPPDLLTSSQREVTSVKALSSG